MRINLHDNDLHLRFAPLTLTRPLGKVLMGIFTNDERWKTYLPKAEIGFVTQEYLAGRFPGFEKPDISVNAQMIPNEDVIAALLALSDGEMLFMDELWLGSNGLGGGARVHYSGEQPVIISERWHLFQKNGEVLEQDFHLLTAGRKSQPLAKTNMLLGDASKLFIEEGAQVEAAVINTKDGVVYIGKDAEIMEGTLVRGPLAMCEHSALKLGSKVYGPTTLGPYCKVGGEVNNVVFFGYSNKGHDGFLGNAIIGEWCNIGADSNASNLKNTYGKIEVFCYETNKYVPTDEQFIGLCMGDHSKCGINTMFNTGTVVGVSSNVFGADFPPKHIPSFSWGGATGFQTYHLEKAVQNANNMMHRRNLTLSQDEKHIFEYLFGKK
jgi:UDP-N-acetylglucosamine diphosphorylase/glucosamine-1-phosphate N-acetyltransferase